MAFQTVGIVGVGQMGSGIAEVFARAGCQVVAREINDELLERGKAYLQRSFARGVERGTLPQAEADAALGRLSFEEPDEDRFPALRLARRAGEVGGTFPAVLNAANEVAVRAFLDGEIPFASIPAVIEKVMARGRFDDSAMSTESIAEMDVWARAKAATLLRHKRRRQGSR